MDNTNQNQRPPPSPGQIWLHNKTKNAYVIHCLGCNEADQTEMVVYSPLKGEGKNWIRPLENFLEVADGVERFTCLS